jgi:hypothetical protein
MRLLLLRWLLSSRSPGTAQPGRYLATDRTNGCADTASTASVSCTRADGVRTPSSPIGAGAFVSAFGLVALAVAFAVPAAQAKGPQDKPHCIITDSGHRSDACRRDEPKPPPVVPPGDTVPPVVTPPVVTPPAPTPAPPTNITVFAGQTRVLICADAPVRRGETDATNGIAANVLLNDVTFYTDGTVTFLDALDPGYYTASPTVHHGAVAPFVTGHSVNGATCDPVSGVKDTGLKYWGIYKVFG